VLPHGERETFRTAVELRRVHVLDLGETALVVAAMPARVKLEEELRK